MNTKKAAFTFVVLWSGDALAQAGPAAPAGGGAGGGTGGPSVVVLPPAPVAAPAAPSGPVGGGNATGSSSKPISGPNDRDGFDLGRKAGSGGAVRGGENGAIFGAGSRLGGSSKTRVHTVRRGDTLWDICDFYFDNPYQWPRIWSYNPEIKNPHWIYPGESVKLRQGEIAEPTSTKSGLVSRKQVSPGTLFLRDQGFVEDEKEVVWGEITGAREDKVFLSDFDEVYIRILQDREIKVGQELTIFRPGRTTPQGVIIEIQGTARIDEWNAKDKIARARIIETDGTIERGARVGPFERRFQIVPPVRNEVDLKAEVISAGTPHNLYGQNQVVYINAGSKQGIKPGNQLRVLRKGDEWHDTLPSKGLAAKRIMSESEAAAETESMPYPKDRDALPEELTAELRVISVRENSAMCVLMSARREVEPGEAVHARKGY
jgi:LysM domain